MESAKCGVACFSAQRTKRRFAAHYALLTILLVYWRTLAPDLTWANFGADGPELITAVVTHGTAHPPGYPTYLLLSRLFTLLPLGPLPYRFNLFSAVCMTLAATLLVDSGQWIVDSGQRRKERTSLLTPHYQLSTINYQLLTAFVFAFSALVWGQATITEVYALNTAVLAALLATITQQKNAPPEKTSLLTPHYSLLTTHSSLLIGFLFGLSLTTHPTSLFFLPLVVTAVPRSAWRGGLASFLLGLSPLLLLPLLANPASPALWDDPHTLRGWLWLISGALYRPALFALPMAQWLDRLQHWGPLWLSQFTWLGVPLALWGGCRRPTFRAEALTIVLYLFYALTSNTPDAIVLTLPTLLILALWLQPALRRLGWLALLLPLTLLALNAPAQNLSQDYTVRQSTLPALTALPADALLVSEDTATTFAVWYFQQVEGVRPDVLVVDRNLFGFAWYTRRLQAQAPTLTWPPNGDWQTFEAQNAGQRPFIPLSLLPTP